MATLGGGETSTQQPLAPSELFRLEEKMQVPKTAFQEEVGEMAGMQSLVRLWHCSSAYVWEIWAISTKRLSKVVEHIVCPPVSCFSCHDTNDPLSLPCRALRSAMGAKNRDVKATLSLNPKDEGLGNAAQISRVSRPQDKRPLAFLIVTKNGPPLPSTARATADGIGAYWGLLCRLLGSY